jgi:hypothetical protein
MSKYRIDKSKTTKILSMGLGAALAVITLASFAPLLFTEVYAPTSRRGFFCEYRPAAMTDPWMPYTQATIEQVELNYQQNPNLQLNLG